MRHLAPIGLSLLGAALSAPGIASAQAPMPAPPQGVAPDAYYAAPAPSPAPPQAAAGEPGIDQFHRRSLFGKKSSGHVCANCQRKKLMAQGMIVPPPPPQVAMASGECAACQAGTVVVSGPIVAAPPGMVMASAGDDAGRAVVGGAPAGGMMMAGAEPAPIGVVQTNYNAGGPAAAGMSSMYSTGRFDPMAHGEAGKAQQAAYQGSPSMVGPGAPHQNPQVIKHLFGLDAPGRHWREGRERKKRERHAAVAYGAPGGQVTEVPANAVYGRP